jgi:glycosyltransferase involved in cell wall biosynthesis
MKILIRFGGNPLSELKQYYNGKFSRKIFNKFNTISSKFMLKNTDGVIAVSNELKKQLKRIVNQKAKLFVVPQVIVPPVYYTVHRIKKTKYISLLTATNLNYYSKYIGAKKLLSYINQFALLHDYKLHFQIAGGGEFLNRLLKVTTNKTFSSNLEVFVLGNVKNINKLYLKGDIFLYYSTYDFLPNVILEAQSYGLPIIINNFYCFHEYLFANNNAIFFKENNFKDFSLKLEKLINDFRLRNLLSTNNLNFIKDNYNIDKISDYFYTIAKDFSPN